MGCWANCPGTGLFGKGKDCRNCKDRCNSWFPIDNAAACGCKELCASGNTDFTRDGYLNSIGAGSVAEDEIEEANDEVIALQTKEAEDSRKTIVTIISAGFGILVIILVIFLLTRYLRS
jgi:hypothetical protein